MRVRRKGQPCTATAAGTLDELGATISGPSTRNSTARSRKRVAVAAASRRRKLRMKKHDANTLQTLKTRFGALPHQHKLRPYDVIAALTNEISEARDRGYDLDDLVGLLADAGIRLSRNTVRNYLSRARRAPAEVMPTISASPDASTAPSAEKASRERSAIPTAPRSSVREALAREQTPKTDPALIAAAAALDKPSALERARSRARDSETADVSETPGSFKVRPDTPNL